MSETDLSRNVRKAIERMGVQVLRLQSGKKNLGGRWMYLCPKGTPDLLVPLRGGYVIWAEVKRPGENPTAEQQAEHERLRALGHEVHVWRDVQSAIDAVAKAMGRQAA